MTDFSQIVRAARPLPARNGSQFEALRIGGDIFGREGDPWLNLDHFRMADPTFPPHPHAGFSAVTYILPESPGAMANRDSRGDRSLIAQGGIHWTAAGEGIVHEEVPAIPGLLTEGFQIFIRQPVKQEREPAQIIHVEPADVPVVGLPGGGELRVLAGAYEGHEAPFTPPSPIIMLDIALERDAAFDWESPWPQGSLSAYVFAGEVSVNDASPSFPAPTVLVFRRGGGRVAFRAAMATRLFLMAGLPLDAPSVSNGPFVLSSQAELAKAVERYRSGAMGTLPAAWD